MRTQRNIIGNTYGDLTVLEGRGTRILCKCKCGNTKECERCHVLAGKIIDCGCGKLARRKATCRAKYGVDNVSQLEDVKEKRTETCREKFGSDTFFGSDYGKESAKQGVRELYGVDNVSQADIIKQKKAQTCLEHFGVDNPFSSPEIQWEIRKNHKVKYGVEYPAQVPGNRQKCMCLRNGKMVWPSATPEALAKRDRACLDRFGVLQIMDLPEYRAKAALRSARVNAKGHSRIEKQIQEWLSSLGIQTEPTSINGVYLDLWDATRRIAVEYHGSHWHSPDSVGMHELRQQRLRTLHKDKQQASERDGYRLIQIWEPWWKYRQPQVKSILKATFGVLVHKIDARSTELREVPHQEAKQFFDEFCVEGAHRKVTKTVGLYHGDLLVACAALHGGSRQTGELTVSHWCVREDWVVAGGLSKVAKWATDRWCQDVHAIVNLAVADSNEYEESGWLSVSTWYDYFYVHKNVPYCIPKRERSKGRCGCPPELTEYQWARKQGYLRIYDAGKRKYVFRYNPASG